jgi:hypothetical protein
VTNVAVGLDQWVIAKRWSTGPDDAAPKNFMERRLAHSPRSNACLVTSGLSGCIAVGLVSQQSFCLAHVYSGCEKSNWASYKHQLDLPVAVMGAAAIATVMLGYSDDVDTRKDTFLLLEGWARNLGKPIETKNVGGAVLMRPESASVTFTGKSNLADTDYTQAAPVLQSRAFITNWGKLS